MQNPHAEDILFLRDYLQQTQGDARAVLKELEQLLAALLLNLDDPAVARIVDEVFSGD